MTMMLNFKLENIINAVKFYTIKKNDLRQSRHTVQGAETVQ
jgi:hypothetical protein